MTIRWNLQLSLFYLQVQLIFISFQQLMLLLWQDKVRSSSLFDFFFFLPSCMWCKKKKKELVPPTFSFQEVDLKACPPLQCLCYIRSAWEEFTHLLPVHGCVSVLHFLSSRGNFTVPKLSESNMGFGVLGVFLGLLLEVSTHGPPAVPRTSWRHQGKEWKIKKQQLIFLLFI